MATTKSQPIDEKKQEIEILRYGKEPMEDEMILLERLVDNWKEFLIEKIVKIEVPEKSIEEKQSEIIETKINMQYKLITEWLSDEEKEMLKLLG